MLVVFKGPAYIYIYIYIYIYRERERERDRKGERERESYNQFNFHCNSKHYSTTVEAKDIKRLSRYITSLYLYL